MTVKNRMQKKEWSGEKMPQLEQWEAGEKVGSVETVTVGRGRFGAKSPAEFEFIQ